MPVANPSHLLPNEELSIPDLQEEDTSRLSDADINEKYIRGEIRIVTEQARYVIRQNENGSIELGHWCHAKKADEHSVLSIIL